MENKLNWFYKWLFKLVLDKLAKIYNIKDYGVLANKYNVAGENVLVLFVAENKNANNKGFNNFVGLLANQEVGLSSPMKNITIIVQDKLDKNGIEVKMVGKTGCKLVKGGEVVWSGEYCDMSEFVITKL